MGSTTLVIKRSISSGRGVLDVTLQASHVTHKPAAMNKMDDTVKPNFKKRSMANRTGSGSLVMISNSSSGAVDADGRWMMGLLGSKFCSARGLRPYFSRKICCVRTSAEMVSTEGLGDVATLCKANGELSDVADVVVVTTTSSESSSSSSSVLSAEDDVVLPNPCPFGVVVFFFLASSSSDRKGDEFSNLLRLLPVRKSEFIRGCCCCVGLDRKLEQLLIKMASSKVRVNAAVFIIVRLLLLWRDVDLTRAFAVET